MACLAHKLSSPTYLPCCPALPACPATALLPPLTRPCCHPPTPAAAGRISLLLSGDESKPQGEAANIADQALASFIVVQAALKRSQKLREFSARWEGRDAAALPLAVLLYCCANGRQCSGHCHCFWCMY